MKRHFSFFFSLILSLLLTTSAVGEKYYTIEELHDITEIRWCKVYHTVRNEDVKVDVEIMIPEVGEFPCITASFNDPTEVLPPTKSLGSRTEIEEFEYSSFKNNGFLSIQYPSERIQRQMEKEAKKKGIFRNNFIETRVLNLSAGEFDLDTCYSINNPFTINNVTTMLHEYTEKYFPTQNIQLIPSFLEADIDSTTYNYNKNTGNYEVVMENPYYEGLLQVLYNQLLNGIPVLGWAYEGLSNWSEKTIKGEGIGSMGGDVWVRTMKYVGSDDNYFALGLLLLKSQSILQKDVPLISVSSIISSVEDFILSGKLRRVDSFRLGYVAWRKSDKEFLLIPTWVIEGEVFDDAQAEHRYSDDFYGKRNYAYEYQKLYINAQSGEIFDPWQKGSKRFYNAPPILSWKEVR